MRPGDGLNGPSGRRGSGEARQWSDQLWPWPLMFIIEITLYKILTIERESSSGVAVWL